MIAVFDGLRFLRVLPPLASTPVGLHGCRPPEVRPSPPPIGWLTGFIEVPRLCGLRPSQRLRPALPRLMFMWSALPSVPMVARHSELMRRTSPDGSVIWAHLPSRAVSTALVPALRADLAAAAWLHLHVVHAHAQRNLPQRHAVAHASARRPRRS